MRGRRSAGASPVAVSAPPDSALPFILAASEQAAHRLGWGDEPDDARREADAFGTAATLVERATAAARARDDIALDEAAIELATAPAMLAAFFQNIDLLYDSGFEDADAVSALIMRALERSAEMPSP